MGGEKVPMRRRLLFTNVVAANEVFSRRLHMLHFSTPWPVLIFAGAFFFASGAVRAIALAAGAFAAGTAAERVRMIRYGRTKLRKTILNVDSVARRGEGKEEP